MIHMYTKFYDEIFVRFSVIMKTIILFSFIKENRGTTLRLPCDVVDDVIIMEKTFSCIIWDDRFISDVKLKLCIIIWRLQNDRYFAVATNFSQEGIPEVKYDSTKAMGICDILSFWSMLLLKYWQSYCNWEFWPILGPDDVNDVIYIHSQRHAHSAIIHQV